MYLFAHIYISEHIYCHTHIYVTIIIKEKEAINSKGGMEDLGRG